MIQWVQITEKYMKAKIKTVKTNAKRKSISTKANYSAYEKDFFSWTTKQVNFLKQKEFTKLDIENLIEEIESLGRSEKRTLQSHLENLLMHMLKTKYQQEKKSVSCSLSIKNSRLKAKQVLHENPSLKPKLEEIIKRAYESARLEAALETGLPEKRFPKKCEWTLAEIL
jgi:hypothetical protein